MHRYEYSNIKPLALVMAGVLALALGLVARAQTLDTGKSRLTTAFKQMNVPIDGEFKKFEARISFDPARPTEARAKFDIDMASFDLGKGLDDYNAEVRKKDWFDSAKHPNASFVVESVKPVGANRLDATGKLTLKGKSADVIAPIVWKDEGALRVFDGQVPIKRNAFGIGEGEWRDTSVVADEVIVKFHIVVGK